MKIRSAIFVLLFLGCLPAFAEDYMDLYNRGSMAIQLGNCAEGEQYLQDALKTNPKGDMKRNYFPHYYLAMCALERNALEDAKKLAKQAEGSGISFSPMAKEYSAFKKRLQEKLKAPPQQQQAKTSLSVVVNPVNSVKSLTMAELQQIYKGEKKTWEDGTRILTVLGPEGSHENQAFLSKVCNMDEKAFHAFIESNNISKPVVIEKSEWILRYVFSNPGAIAFYSGDASLQQVKVIEIDGKSPSASDYPLAQ